jgi:tetratricopeptide (TPR) repeat protein
MASSARLDELKKKFEENPRRYFAPLANEHRKSGDLDQAIALCRTHLPQQPGHISGHIVLAQALFEAGSLDESREIFHTALGLDPENLIALRYLGDIAKESRDLDTARGWYARVLEVDPRNDEIVELIRDLDAPSPAPEEASADEGVKEQSSFAPPEADPSAPPPPASAERDARFAPLSLDEMDIDDSFGAPSREGQPNDPPSAQQPNPYAGQASNGAEAPILDAPDIDPFDLDPSRSVDALLEPSAAPSADDFFLTELAGAHATADADEPEPSDAPDSWAAPETHGSEPSAAQLAANDGTALDDDAFYLEPPPAEPAASAEHDAAPNASAESTPAALDSRNQMSIPGMDAFAAEYSTGPYDAIPEPAPNAESIESVASQPTAEWQPPTLPAAASDDGLGLEVMEFVPPSREAPAPPTYAQAPDADPVLGRTPAMATNEQSATPAAFVTETMAELYLQQGFRSEALAVYRELLARNPADASLRERIHQIESGSVSSIEMASVSEDVVESALKRQTGRPPRSVRSFFASLAGRRAPTPREPTAMEPGDEAFEPAVGELSSQPEASSSAEPAAVEQPVAEPAAAAEPEPAARPDRMPPLMSAAETLASFDPFADTAEAEPASMPTVGAAVRPNEPPAEFSTGMATPARQTPLSTAAQSAAPTPTPAPESPARRSLEDLFPDTPATARTDAAAETIASAFGRSEPQGRPTRAASNELSLDHVFRGAPEGAPAPDGGFSFDQFFSDSQTAGGDAAAAAAAPESGRDGGSADAHDIEQFTAWLEGLKKK